MTNQTLEEADLWELSPIRIDWTQVDDTIKLLSVRIQSSGIPDAFSFIEELLEKERREFDKAWEEALLVLPREEQLTKLAKQKENLELKLAEESDEAKIREISMSLSINTKRVKRLQREIQNAMGVQRPRKGRPCQIHREDMRALASVIWLEEPERTIQSIITDKKVQHITGKINYTERTLRNWVKDLAPNRNPGRRLGSPNIKGKKEI